MLRIIVCLLVKLMYIIIIKLASTKHRSQVQVIALLVNN